jgi:hypothetical protein
MFQIYPKLLNQALMEKANQIFDKISPSLSGLPVRDVTAIMMHLTEKAANMCVFTSDASKDG